MLNKKIPTFFAITIIILFSGIVVAGTFLMIKELDQSLLIDQEITLKNININQEEWDNFELFKNNFEENLRPYCFDLNPIEKEYLEDYQGFIWIDNNQEINLIQKTYYLNLNIKENNCIKEIKNYFQEKFSLSQKNSQDNINGFEKGNIKCSIFEIDGYYFILECIDIEKSFTPPVYKEIYKQMNPELNPSINLSINKIINNFALIKIEDNFGRKNNILIKKENNQWKTIQASQEDFLCEIIFDEEVPELLVESCFSYKSGQTLKYNREEREWE